MGTTAIWTWIRAALATIGGALGWYFGDTNGLFYALIVITVVDFVMCLIRHATVEHNVSSQRVFKCALRKVLIFVLVGIGNVIDQQVIGQGSVLRNAVILFYISGEGVSILEHAAAMGLPVPDKLLSALKTLYDDDPLRDTTVHGAKSAAGSMGGDDHES